MSRAFVSDKEDWAYCPKAGERCLHATEGRDCTRKDCPHSSKIAEMNEQSSAETGQTSGNREQSSLRVVRRQPKEKSASNSEADRPSKTKRANIKIPRPWGGRSGSR